MAAGTAAIRTEIAYGAAIDTEIAYGAAAIGTEIAEAVGLAKLLLEAGPYPISYAMPTQCPVLIQRMVPCSISLHDVRY
eukprot:1695428-Rhodomonas_salina.3